MIVMTTMHDMVVRCNLNAPVVVGITHLMPRTPRRTTVVTVSVSWMERTSILYMFPMRTGLLMISLTPMPSI